MKSSLAAGTQKALSDYYLIFEKYRGFKQHHIFDFWSELSKEQRDSLLSQASKVDLKQLESLRCCDSPELPKKMSTADAFVKSSNKESDGSIGVQSLKASELAVVTAAGGLGSRLQAQLPKGMLSITPIKKKTLFQVFAEKIQAAQKRYSCKIPWIIVTSPKLLHKIKSFFEQHNFFGLESVTFLTQPVLPAITSNGKLILTNKYTIATAPNGHGGVFEALKEHVPILKKQNIKHISYIQVDNPLVRPIDECFLGAHIRAKSEFSSKFAAKENPQEKVGLFCASNNGLKLIEYSIFPEKLKHSCNSLGELLFNHANIAAHLFDLDFVDSIACNQVLPFNVALKTIQSLDHRGESYCPGQPNALQFEKFIFDALPHAKNPILYEVDRASEFSPVKNNEGPYSPETCKEDQQLLFRSFLKSVNVCVPEKITIEISPLFADNLKDFQLKWGELIHKPKIQDPFYIE